MSTPHDTSQIAHAVAGLDAWFTTMRGADGYGGPVAHWWQQSLLYTGAGLDWRYEGIIAGYLNLWHATSEPRYLVQALQAGDDLLAGQQLDGHFAASSFERNPASAGTPHEAACAAALLELARALRPVDQQAAGRYQAAALTNLDRCWVGKLWDAGQRRFADDPGQQTFVPNKACTAAEACFLAAEATGDALWAHYALGSLEHVVRLQVTSGRCAGAIAQNQIGSRVVHKYFPIYIARCVPALVRAYEWSSDARYAEAAIAAFRFIVQNCDAQGLPPVVVYQTGRTNHTMRWVAAQADVLRAADLLRPYGLDADLAAVHAYMLAGQDATGGIRTAAGFTAQRGARSTLPDARDLLHVAGWCDKAFRYLSAKISGPLPLVESACVEQMCTLGGQTLRLVETPTQLAAWAGAELRYVWHKGDAWASTAAPEWWLR